MFNKEKFKFDLRKIAWRKVLLDWKTVGLCKILFVKNAVWHFFNLYGQGLNLSLNSAQRVSIVYLLIITHCPIA